MNLLLSKFSTLQKVIIISFVSLMTLAFCFLMRDLISPFFIAFILSYLLSPLVDRLEFVFQKRILAVFVIYILVACGFVFLFNNIIPLLINEFNELSSRFPFYFGKFKEWSILIKNRIETDIPLIQELSIIDNILIQSQEIILDFAQKIPNFFFSTFSTVSYLLLIPIILFFFLNEGPEMKTSFYKLIPNKYFETLIYLFYSMGNKLGNYLRGIFIETIIIGMLTILMLFIIKVEYALLFGTVAGIANLIPYIGPIFGAIPAIVVFYLKMKTLESILVITIGFAIVQTIDNILLKPIIYSQSVNLHPLTVLIVLLFGGMFAGVWGLILAVPFAGILKVTISILIKEITFRIQFNQELDNKKAQLS